MAIGCRIRSVMRMARELLLRPVRDRKMEAFVIAGTLVGSFVTAFWIQKAALEGLFRIMDPNRRTR